MCVAVKVAAIYYTAALTLRAYALHTFTGTRTKMYTRNGLDGTHPKTARLGTLHMQRQEVSGTNVCP